MKCLKGIINRTLFSLLFFLMCLNLNAQENSNNKNSIYLSYGTTIQSSQVSISYERLIFKSDIFSTKIKATYGEYLTNNADFEEGARVYENYIGLGVVQLLGFLEFNAGLAYTNYELAKGLSGSSGIHRLGDNNDLIFNGSFGLRYERNNFLARAGIGNLELLYLGLGIKF